MTNSEIIKFLKTYLKLFDVSNVEIININKDFIRGYAIFDDTEPFERQEFVWHINKNNKIQLNKLIPIIEKIISNKLHTGDKISQEIEKIKIAGLDDELKKKLLKQLFDIEIKMIDNGIETDSFFLHQ